MRPNIPLILLLAALSLPATAAPSSTQPAHADSCATCYGGHDCRACHTCQYCAHCNSGVADKCDVYYLAQGQTPPWEKKAKPAARAKAVRHRRHTKA